jgi:uncharacterized protein (TIGR00297 family)
MGLAAALAIAIAAWRAGALSASGAAAATVLGTLAVAAGWDWAAVLITYFVTGALVTRFRAATKIAVLGARVAKGGARDAMQVLANGGAFALAAIGDLAVGGDVWRLLACASLASSSADTWATELGTLSRSTPRSIISGKRTDAGPSGAVTALGLLAAIGGAGTVALVAVLAGWGSAAIVAALAGGVAGCLLDSLLGATVQARRWCPRCQLATEQPVHRCGVTTRVTGGVSWLDNDGVNAVSTVAGGLIGLAVAAALRP